jgi:hypothetical protein
MQELLKLQAELQKKNTAALEINTSTSINLSMDVKKLSEQVDHAANDEEFKQKKKREEELNENLKDLGKILKDNIKAYVKAGGGDKVTASIEKSDAEKAKQTGGLRSFLLGGAKGEAVKKDSWLQKAENLTGLKVGKYSATGAIDRYLTKREEKQATAKEKKEFIESALTNDKRGIALKNLKGEEYAREDAGKRFDAIKAKEAEVKEHQAKMDKSTGAGYNAKKKDIEARDKAVAELVEMDPRRAKDFKDARGTPLTEMNHSIKEEEAERQKKVAADQLEEQHKMLSDEDTIAKTLIESLDVQHKQLEALLGIAAEGLGGGGGLLDAASNFIGKGAKAGGGMLSKAAGFIGKNAGKLGAIGGIAMGAYDAYTGWGDANEAEARGDITHDEANVKKGEAVGGGTGGAAGAWGGAAAGAELGGTIGAAFGGIGAVPGAAIGGLLGGAAGYFGGSKIGSKIGGTLVEGYQGLKGLLGFGEEKSSQALPEGVTPAMVAAADLKSPDIIGASKSNADMAADKTIIGNQSTNVVNAPSTTINNHGSAQASQRSDIRNPDSTVNRYISSRYAA